jgi:hypothetical protein
MSYFETTKINTNNHAGDAFGRLRISSPTTIFDTQLQYDASPLFITGTVSGGGTRTHVPNESSVNIYCGTTSGDEVISQTKEYFRYVPGKSMMIIMSRVLGVPKTNTRQRTGLFDAYNGVFFENNGSTFGVVRRTNTSGTPTDIRVAQSAFNLDKLDGTGASGITLDLSKTNIFIIDLQWLGAGRIRFGLDLNGVVIYCHEILNANVLTLPYMTTANLPSRVELTNTGTAASGTTLKVICTSVIIEDGASNAVGIQNSTNNGITTVAVTTRRAILSIRPAATFNSIVNRSKVEEFSFELWTDANCLWEIVYNGSLGGSPSFASVGTSSTVEKDVAGTTVTGGVVLASGYAAVSFKGTSGATKSLVSKLPFCLDIAGANPTNLSLVVTSFTGTANVAGSFSWKEIY